MSVQSEIQRITQAIAKTYTALAAVGATMPTTRNSANLEATAKSLNGKLNADTVDGFHVAVQSAAPTTNDTSVITFVL